MPCCGMCGGMYVCDVVFVVGCVVCGMCGGVGRGWCDIRGVWHVV